MKKKKSNLFLTMTMIVMGAFAMFTFNSCEKDEDPAEDPIASFQVEIDEENYLQVTFMNFSQNAETYLWDFGDGNTSTEENPVHVYDTHGDYEVVLTATNSDGVSANFAQVIEIKDPNEALALLAGETTKTWKLYREGTSMGVGPDAENARSWWSLENTGDRPCVYYHEFTFNREGEFIFEDNGSFWGEDAIFGGDNPTDVHATCFEAVAANMINNEGADVSAWLSGTHAFEYNPTNNTVTLNGLGAWMGLPHLGTSAESNVPENSKSFQISIEEHDGYDLMIVSYSYAELYWDFTYASYSDPSLEPPVEEEPQEFGEDLPDTTPDEIFVTFAAKDAENMATIDTVPSGSSVIFGVEDPADAEAQLVGEFIRTGGQQYQELQFRTSPDLFDIQFDNFTEAKIDIFVPAETDFVEGGLVRQFVFGFADMSATEEWWNSPVQFLTEGEDFVVGEWTTYTFDLTDVKAREDLDMIYLGIGGGGHEAEGIFYVRNLIFE